MNKLIIILALAALFLFSACDNRNKKNNETGRDTTVTKSTQTENTRVGGRVGIYWNHNKTYTYANRSEFRKDLSTALAKLDKRIDSLEAKERTAKGDLRDKYDKAIKDLRDKRMDVKDQLDKADKVKQDDWDGFRKDVNTAWSHVEDAWNDVLKDMRDTDKKK